MALTHHMRGILLIAATIATLGCSREERDVLREFPAPRLMSQTSGNASVWKLELVEPTRLHLRLRDKAAGAVAFRVVAASLAWAPAASGLSGELSLRADADPQISEQVGGAWLSLSPPSSPLEAHFRVLENDALAPLALDLESPQRQTARLALRGELEARGVRGELQVFVSVELAASAGRTQSTAAVRDERLVTARCEKATVLQPLRYGLDLRESHKPGRAAPAAEVGCQLTFVAHRLSSNVSLAQKDSEK
jgi:hypothetical protein